MKLKSYFSASVESAMQQARRELGDEAMLLNSRPTTGEARRLGAHEVVFALPDGTAEPVVFRGLAKSSGSTRRKPNETSDELVDDLMHLRREMHQIKETMARATALPTGTSCGTADPEVNRVHNLLLARDVSPDLAQDLLAASLRTIARDVSGFVALHSLDSALRDQISKRVRAQPNFEAATESLSSSPRLVAFVGPPGSGKTSSLIKLAIRNGLQSRKPLLIVSLDNYRVASAEQLRAYACILGVAFQQVETVRAMRAVLDEHRHKYWVFVDTPGCGPRETEVIQELSEITKLDNEIETHLVLSAAMKSSDLRVAVERFGPLNAGKLLFTHLDETEQHGGVLSAAAISGRPVSYLSSGQRIPEDLEPATAERLLGLVFPSTEQSRRSDEAKFFHQAAGTAAAGL
jgi:flagellar biosynthesis protein FlhF